MTPIATKDTETGLVFVLFVAITVFVPFVALAQTAETIGEIRVHGNHTTPDADVIGLSGLKTGEPASDARLAGALDALRTSDRFASVDVRKRFRSIDNPADILVVIVVDERAGISADDLTPGVVARLRSAALWMPILNYADGYGMTYGLQAAFADPIGPDSLLSFPLSWGGERRAGVQLERAFNDQRTQAGVAFWVNRRVNPFFDLADRRQQLRFEAAHALANWVKVGASARIAQVEFGDGYSARHAAGGPHVTFDTRINPTFPRNAIHTTLGWEHVAFESGSAGRFTTDARGYVGIGRSTILALRGQLVRSDATLPQAEQSLLGGADTLRGYRAGHRVGDNLAAVSVEVRRTLSSPIGVSQLGVKAFIDAGTTWNAGARLGDQRFERGIGGGVFMSAAVVMLNLDVAWPEEDAAGARTPRVHVGLGIDF